MLCYDNKKAVTCKDYDFRILRRRNNKLLTIQKEGLSVSNEQEGAADRSVTSSPICAIIHLKVGISQYR